MILANNFCVTNNFFMQVHFVKSRSKNIFSEIKNHLNCFIYMFTYFERKKGNQGMYVVCCRARIKCYVIIQVKTYESKWNFNFHVLSTKCEWIWRRFWLVRMEGSRLAMMRNFSFVGSQLFFNSND